MRIKNTAIEGIGQSRGGLEVEVRHGYELGGSCALKGLPVSPSHRTGADNSESYLRCLHSL